MKFYRVLHPVRLISFDLDDTLYDNRQVILRAEAEFIARFSRLTGIPLSNEHWQQWKWRLFRQKPVEYENVTRWRAETARALLKEHGQNAGKIERVLQDSLNHFLHWRHQITVPEHSRRVLAQLKRRYPLVAITNGNVAPARIGLDFDLTLTGGVQGRAKPQADLFRQTASCFGIRPQEILHVGDNLVTDVQGAIQAGCQAAWLNVSGRGLGAFSEATLLPTVEINDLTELLTLS